MKIIRRMWANEFVRGSMFFTTSSFVVNILNYFFNLLAGRSLGPIGYSDVTTLFSYISIIAVPIVVFSTFIIQKISSAGKDRVMYAQSLEQLFWITLKKSWFVIVALIFMIPFVPRLTNLSNFTGYMLIPFVFLYFILTFYGAIFQGLRLFFLFGVLGILGTGIKLLGALLVFFGIDGVSTIITCIIISNFIPIVISYIQTHSFLRKNISTPMVKIQKNLFDLISNKQFLLILISSLALTLLNNVDIVFVKKFFTSQLAGIYSSWSLFAKIIFYALGPLINISFIFFSSSNKKDYKTLNYSLIILGFV